MEVDGPTSGQLVAEQPAPSAYRRDVRYPKACDLSNCHQSRPQSSKSLPLPVMEERLMLGWHTKRQEAGGVDGHVDDA